MADHRHLELASRGSDAWNRWRRDNSEIAPDLSNAVLPGAELAGADLSFANLFAADLAGADLGGADFNSANLMYSRLGGAELQNADFRQANLFAADLTRAGLKGSRFSGAHASGVKLREADLEGANLFVADISRADLSGACLRGSNFFGSMLNDSNLSGADCRAADLSGADLTGALLVEVDFTEATLSDCKIKGVTATGLVLEGAVENDLMLTVEGEPEISVDGFEAALYVLSVINGTAETDGGILPGRKVVLLLGAYPHERKAFLNAVREEIRKAGYSPLAFDFETAGSTGHAGLVQLLARLSTYALADLGGMKELPPGLLELVATAAVPIKPILAGAASPELNAELNTLIDSPSMNELFQTDDAAGMLTALSLKVIEPMKNIIDAAD